MLHAPACQSKQRKSSAPDLSSERRREPQPMPIVASGFARLQAVYGNQAILRMIDGQQSHGKASASVSPSHSLLPSTADLGLQVPVSQTKETPSAPPPAPTQKRACIQAKGFPEERSGVITQGGRVGEKFRMGILWEQDAARNCDCSCGEYRQFVKGHYILNGKPVVKKLWGGAQLEEDVYHEDGDASGHRYGHRDEPAFPSDTFARPDRSSGCLYKGSDFPSIDYRPGDVVDILLYFKGQAFDRCTNTFDAPEEWKVKVNQTMS